MIMKTKNVKNTRQMVRRGNWKITRGQRGQVHRGGGEGKRGELTGGQTGQKIAPGGIARFAP